MLGVNSFSHLAVKSKGNWDHFTKIAADKKQLVDSE